MHSHWYESFFQGLSVEMWEAVTTPEMTLAEVNFFERALSVPPGAHILDIPCGGGRHAIEFARRVLPHSVRPTFDETEQFCKAAAANAAAAGKAKAA